MIILDEDKLIEIFFNADDFAKKFQPLLESYQLEKHKNKSKARWKPSLSYAEMMTILIVYHHSGFKNFKTYYIKVVLNGGLSSYFPAAPSYNRFIELIPRLLFYMWYFLKLLCIASDRNGLYFIDSTKLPVCHNRRIHSHKVFKDIAARGKTSVGFFYGLKLHIVINTVGELIAFRITAGNVADNNKELLRNLLKGLKGRVFGDKGYHTSLLEELQEQGLTLFAKLKRNMKNKPVGVYDRVMLMSRSLVESVIRLLKFICDIDHTRHRSPVNAVVHLLSGLCAYCFRDKKPRMTTAASRFGLKYID